MRCPMKNDVNSSTCLRVFVTKCREGTNGSAQPVSQEMAPDPSPASSERGGGAGAWEEQAADRGFCQPASLFLWSSQRTQNCAEASSRAAAQVDGMLLVTLWDAF